MARIATKYLYAMVGAIAFRVARRCLPRRSLARKCQRVLASVNL